MGIRACRIHEGHANTRRRTLQVAPKTHAQSSQVRCRYRLRRTTTLCVIMYVYSIKIWEGGPTPSHPSVAHEENWMFKTTPQHLESNGFPPFFSTILALFQTVLFLAIWHRRAMKNATEDERRIELPFTSSSS